MNPLYSPLTLAILAALLALVAVRFSRRFLITSSLMFMLIFLGLTTPLGANLLVRAVESAPSIGDRSMLESCPEAVAIVFLSGGMRRPARDASDFGALTSETLDRILALQTSNPPRHLPLVIAGGGPFRIAESEVIESLIRRLNHDSLELRPETRSTTTSSSAWEVARMLPASERSIILATSALHLPRASWTFRTAGFEVCPWRLNSLHVPVGSPTGLWPQTSAIEKSERALHELLGQLYYRLTLGRESFPS